MWWDSQEFVSVEHEHPGLVTGLLDLLRVIEQSPSIFGAFAMDYRFTRRAARLYEHLDSAGVLLERHRLPSALGLLRIGFEHSLTDRLLLNARRRRVRYENVTDKELAHLQAMAECNNPPAMADVTSVRRVKSGAVVIERDAQRLVDEFGRLTDVYVSPYFEALNYHNPLTGRPGDLHDRLSIHGTPADQRASAIRTSGYWRQYLTWEAIVDNLKLNGFYSSRDAGRLQTHYAFLSAFGHPTEYGYNRLDHDGDPCHMCTELAVLYMATFAAIEVSALVEHCKIKMDPMTVEPYLDMVAETDRVTSHLWFPPGEASIWDRHQVVLGMHTAAMHSTGSTAGVPFGTPMVDPTSLTDDEIPYYLDPLTRLVGLHESSYEISTGLVYTSPWPHQRVSGHP